MHINKEIFIAILLIHSSLLIATPAVVIVPIADAYGALPISTSIPLECKKAADCPRLMQLLAHERVTIIKEQGDYALINAPHFFYITQEQPQQHHASCWIKKEHLCALQEIPNHDHLLPTPTAMTPPPAGSYAIAIAILKLPWQDHTTKIFYSVGTRFVIDRITKKDYVVHMLDPLHKQMRLAHIPQKLCINLPTNASYKTRQEAYVTLVRSLAHLDKGFIPYVWGGCSFTHPYNNFFEVLPSSNDPTHSHIIRKEFSYNPLPGFDCAGLILRAAQCCGIPFFFKNSTTIAHYMRPLQPEETIEEGDIIWIYGHVMVVADIRHHTIVEARSHYHGFGKVHEISLNKEFKGMHTFEDLKRAFFSKQGLERLNAAGEVVQKITKFKILKFSSIKNKF
jgi:hypothetical protein